MNASSSKVGENVPKEVRNLELRNLALQGAISGLFFAQTVSWQELVDVIIVEVAGGSASEPVSALWRAIVVTLFTTFTAWGLLVLARRCDACCTSTYSFCCVRPAIEFTTSENPS